MGYIFITVIAITIIVISINIIIVIIISNLFNQQLIRLYDLNNIVFNYLYLIPCHKL